MKQEDLFSAEKDTIELSGIDSIIKFTRFHPSKPDIFLDGLELAEDLRTDTGTILYTQGTQISSERISRLLQLRESNPNLSMVFKIKRSAKLIQKFRDEISDRLKQLFERRQGSKIFRDMLAIIGQNIESFVEQILSDENITLAIYKVKFICESAKSKRSFLFMDHAINVAIFSAAVASTEPYSSVVGSDKVKLTDLMKASLFHNYGSLLQIDVILDAPADERLNRYWEANRNGYFSLGGLKLNFDIMDSIRYLCEYYAGRKDFINKEEWSATMANIILVVDAFLQAEGGLFREPQPVRQVVDHLNVKAMEKEYNILAIQALTLGLSLQDIFDFYTELESLIKQCVNDAETPAAYPLTGFKSPTIFICKKNIVTCPHYEAGVKAVNLVKKMGELVPGEYKRCKLLTPKLLTFYKEHYGEIKETISDKK
ncbi:MAG: hypothetical protein JXQ83_09830 [Candidatus Glassbacteria bacterium]|nr:hypothetical protein [Candidatus Glassbacteria bacterium]